MTEKHHIIPVWFFVGLLLLVYGVMIVISGLIHWNSPPSGVELTELHAPVWWGSILTVLGSVYCAMFWPGKKLRD
jgi:hypothetical protein